MPPSLGWLQVGGRRSRLPPPLDPDREPRPGGIAARVRRLARDEGPADREAGARTRFTPDPDLPVHGVAGRDLVGDAGALGSPRSANGFRPGTGERGRRNVELEAGHGKRARPGLVPNPIAHVPFKRAAPRRALVDTGAAGDREALGLEAEGLQFDALGSVREREADLSLAFDDEAAGGGEGLSKPVRTVRRPEPVE